MPRDTTPTQEADNQEQDDGSAQAQTVADDALTGRADSGAEDSERGGSPDVGAVTPDDVPDLVDTMEQMVSSGRIDMGAYRGEPAHDDEAASHGADDEELGEAAPNRPPE